MPAFNSLCCALVCRSEDANCTRVLYKAHFRSKRRYHALWMHSANKHGNMLSKVWDPLGDAGGIKQLGC